MITKKQILGCLIFGAILGIVFYCIGISTVKADCPCGTVGSGYMYSHDKPGYIYLYPHYDESIEKELEVLKKQIDLLNKNKIGLDITQIENLRTYIGTVSAKECEEQYRINKEKEKESWHVGQKVWEVRRGWGKVIKIERIKDGMSMCDDYPIEVKFDSEQTKTDIYLIDGRHSKWDKYPSLYLEEMKIVPLDHTISLELK